MARPPWLVLCATLAVCPAASAQTNLFSFTAGIGGTQPGRTDTVSFPISYFSRSPTLFEDLSFTPADVGRTVLLLPADDPDFGRFTSLLTDGINQQLLFQFFPAPAHNFSGVAFTEPQVVWNDRDDPRIDLRGRTIDAYSLRVDMLTISNGPERSEFQSRITFSAISIPEPGAAAACLPSAGLLLRRRRIVTRRPVRV